MIVSFDSTPSLDVSSLRPGSVGQRSFSRVGLLMLSRSGWKRSFLGRSVGPPLGIRQILSGCQILNLRFGNAHKVQVGLDNTDAIIVWDHRIAGQSLFKGTFFEKFAVQNGVGQSNCPSWTSPHALALAKAKRCVFLITNCFYY